MSELTPRDDIKKRVSEILKRVDRLIRAGEIDQAVREIIQAKEIDPKNVYITAYEERLAYLKQEHEQHEEEERTRKQAEEAARRRDEELRKRQEEERTRKEIEKAARRRNEELQRKREEEESRAAKEAALAQERTPPAVPGNKGGETRSVEQLEEELRTAEAELLKQEEKTREGMTAHTVALAKYKAELVKAWEDGATTPVEENGLKEFRWRLGIAIEEHTRLTKEAQRESYLKAFKDAWSSGSITPERANELAQLRNRFKISAEEFDSVEAEILWEIRSGIQIPQLVLIDDDVRLLNVVTETLQEAGYKLKCFTTSDDAYRYLKEHTPDLIISDINLETSTMGGFTFYEKVREIERLHDIPFIFLSGLTDEVLIRTGKELGVDDYLTKPFSDETLLATIKGKLKRFKQLRETHGKRRS